MKKVFVIGIINLMAFIFLMMHFFNSMSDLKSFILVFIPAAIIYGTNLGCVLAVVTFFSKLKAKKEEPDKIEDEQ